MTGSGPTVFAFFEDADRASRFAAIALACSKIYISDEDRYAMQRLSELLADALAAGVIGEDELLTTEEAVIGKLRADPALSAEWAAFRALRRIERAAKPDARPLWRKIRAKHRRIDPFVEGRGRVSALDPSFAAALRDFMNEEHDYYIRGE